MNEKETQAVLGCLHGVAMDGDPDFMRQEISQPEIMIAGDVMDFDAAFNQGRQLEDDFQMLFGDGGFVFEPEIKEIAEDDQPVAIGTNQPKKLFDLSDLVSFFIGCAAAEMGVGKNVKGHVGESRGVES
jgi:hypothetical protein